MSAALDIRTNRHPTQHRISTRDIDPDDTNRITTMEQQLGMISCRALVRTVLVVDAELSACLEQHVAANLVVVSPLTGFDRRHQRVVPRLFCQHDTPRTEIGPGDATRSVASGVRTATDIQPWRILPRRPQVGRAA